MRLRGLVTGVRQGKVSSDPKYADRGPTFFVDVEGFSMMPGRNCGELPSAGREVEAVVSVKWRPGKPPLHFLESWEPAV